jgi:hypothetical protein
MGNRKMHFPCHELTDLFDLFIADVEQAEGLRAFKME